MNIRRIVMRGFMSHVGGTTLELPPTGLVVVTGQNGSGKSSMIEAVAVSCWGKTLRGTSPWRDGEAGLVSVETDELSATRTITAKGGTVRTQWAPHVGETPVFDTQTKAQEGLSARVGELDVWRRTHVFSSQDAAHFTAATDGQRKALLETILGLECFDTAYARAKGDQRAVDAKVRQIESALLAAESAANAVRRHMELATRSGGPSDPEPVEPAAPPVEPLMDAQVALEARLANQSSLTSASRKAREIERVFTIKTEELRRCQNDVAVLAGGQCPTCKHTLSPNDPHRLELQADLERVQAELKVYADQRELRNAEVQELTELGQALWAEENARSLAERNYTRALDAHRAWEKQHADWLLRRASREKAEAAATAELKVHEDRAATLAKSLKVAKREQSMFEEIGHVLGLKGVRAHVLGKALGGIEAVANGWLEKVARVPLKVTLRPYSETASGTAADKISLEIEGAGGGQGYRAASGGERRRIDAALLLALAEVSAASYGRAPGTVFMDEVFDALDGEGVESVGEALAELARDRAVVLITHSEALVASLPAALRLRVVDGTIQ